MTTRRSVAGEALRRAGRGLHEDPERLVAGVPAWMREAARRRARPADGFPALAAWALPRLAAATAAAVVIAVTVSLWNPSSSSTASFESLILDDGVADTGDELFDALLGAERNHG